MAAQRRTNLLPLRAYITLRRALQGGPENPWPEDQRLVDDATRPAIANSEDQSRGDWAELAVRAKTHRQAFAALYDVTYPRVYSYVMRTVMNVAVAEDLVGDIFLKAMKGLNSFDSRRGGFITWLYGIATNVMADHFRRLGVRAATSSAGDTADLAAGDPDPAEHAETLENYRRLHSALARLKPKERLAVVLYYFEDQPHKQIAAIMGCRPGTVKWRLHRARRHLAAILAPQEGEKGNAS